MQYELFPLEIPPGYIRQAPFEYKGIRDSKGCHPWGIGVTWTIKGGKQRYLKLRVRYFESPEKAISHATMVAWNHYKARNKPPKEKL